ncbi:MAG TPA: response regulator [Verrucomicrobiae bacterium]|nr:response regulator [Verrucomicrobiae bacterium]
MSDYSVLVVEDDANMQGFLQEVLASEGYSVLTASDGQEALTQAFARKPDLILLDLLMPNLDGVTFCRAIRADQRTHDVPIVVVTSLNMQAKLEESMAAGADDFIGKPFDVRDLIARVHSMLEVKHITNPYERMKQYTLALRQLRPPST